MNLKNQGKPLISFHRYSKAGLARAFIMFSLAALVARLFRSESFDTPATPAAMLMEIADARAGLDARHAQELRAAASAWLSVVR